jgi:hypothetical protein
MTTFVVSSAGANNPCRTVLGFRNVLSQNIAVGSWDASYPLSLAFDDSYHSEFSPGTPGPATSVYEFFLPAVTQLNYFSICSKNANDAGLSVQVEVYRASTAAYSIVAGFGSMTNGKPVMVYFGDLFTTGYADALKVKISLTYTSKVYIMSMMCGTGIVFPRTMSTGFQPSFAAYLDDVEQFYADDGLNMTIGRRLAKGKQLKGSINYVKMSTLKEFWEEYANHVLNSKTISLLWNTKMPDECIYGLQVPDRLTKPTYKNSNFAQVDFEVIGWS